MIQRDHTFEENVFKFWEFLYLKNKQKIVYLNSLLFICKCFFFIELSIWNYQIKFIQTMMDNKLPKSELCFCYLHDLHYLFKAFTYMKFSILL